MSNEVDGIVGRRIRALRSARGQTQSELGRIVGVRFQQIQKYENGTNRVSASRLLGISHALGVPITHFFDGIDLDRPSAGAVDLQPHLHDEEVLSLAQDLARLAVHERHAIRSLVRSLRQAGPAAEVARGGTLGG